MFGAIVLEDQNRLLPWVVQYVLLLVALCELHGDSHTLRRSVLVLCGGIYFWSGVHKLNSTFVEQIFPDLMLPLWGPPGPVGALVNAVGGQLAPWGETAVGVLLVWPYWARAQSLGVLLGVAMHLFILLSVGPLGAHQYVSIWPWNAACIIVLLLMRRPPEPDGLSHDLPLSRRGAERWSGRRKERRSWLVGALFVGCWVLPVLFFFVSWYPAYLSWSMFGGDVKQGVVLARSAADIETVRGLDMFQNRESFVPFLLAPIRDADAFEWKSLVYFYPLHVLGVPFVPERSVIVNFFALLCQDANQAAGLALEIQQPAHWIFGGWTPERLVCSDVVLRSC